MQKTIGIILIVIGGIASLMTGIQTAQNSDSFSIFGVDVAVSKADWMPLIISVVVLVIGVVMYTSARKGR